MAKTLIAQRIDGLVFCFSVVVVFRGGVLVPRPGNNLCQLVQQPPPGVFGPGLSRYTSAFYQFSISAQLETYIASFVFFHNYTGRLSIAIKLAM